MCVRQAVGFTGAYTAQIGGRDALWFLQHTRIPDQQGRLACRFERRQSLCRLPPEVQAQQIGLPFGRAQQIREAFCPGGRMGWSTSTDVGAQLTQQQAMRAVAPLHQGNDTGDECAHQSRIKQGVKPHNQGGEKPLQLRFPFTRYHW
ncbi:MAG TPA: hypothetical protein VGF38_18960 [Ktedonobacterales bacterium]|jgi:hypothetical protein